MSTTSKKLYALMVPMNPASWGTDYRCALIEDTGEVLHEHVSSSKQWGRADLEGGLARNHNIAARFPDGYELVEVDRLPDEVREANAQWAASETSEPPDLAARVAAIEARQRDYGMHDPTCSWRQEEKHYAKHYDYLPASRSACDCWLRAYRESGTKS